MSFILRRCVFAMWALLAAFQAHAQQGVAVGFVLDVTGQVVLSAGGNRQRAEILDRIDIAHTLTVPIGGKVVFLFRPERAEYTFFGPAAIQFGAGGVVVKTGNAGLVRSLPAGVSVRLEPNSRTRPEVRATATGMISPDVGETVLTNRPIFSWDSGAARSTYELTLIDCGSDLVNCSGIPMKVTLQAPSWRPSEEDALLWGHFYRWTVSQQAKKKTRSDQQGWFFVVAPEQLELLSALHPGESSEIAPYVLYAQALEEAGARREARDIWQQLTTIRPEQRAFTCKAAGRAAEQCRRIGEPN
ncbi:MAG: hypothetical protein RIR70_1392 [Pseudomonadota bacterium]